MDTTEGKRLIAAFMDDVYTVDRGDIINFGEKPSALETSNSFHVTELMYDQSYDWLMPVVNRINALGKEYSLAIFKTYFSMTDEKANKFHRDFSYSHSTLMNPSNPVRGLFDLVVHFLTWYKSIQ